MKTNLKLKSLFLASNDITLSRLGHLKIKNDISVIIYSPSCRSILKSFFHLLYTNGDLFKEI